jgi:hypothetical protein
MRSASSSALDNFLFYFTKSKEVGLLLVSENTNTSNILRILNQSGYSLAYSWRGVLHNLALNGSVVFYINQPLNKEEYDLIIQYQNHSGSINLIEKQTMQSTIVHFNPGLARLLIVAEEQSLSLIESKYDLMSVVGLIEYV